jgi:hypothetical protein
LFIKKIAWRSLFSLYFTQTNRQFVLSALITKFLNFLETSQGHYHLN